MKKLALLLLLMPALTLAKPKAKPPAPILSPIRSFAGADLVWSLHGERVLGPESAAVIERLVSQPAALGNGCTIGDLTLKARTVEVQVKCADGPHLALAKLTQGLPFAVELWSGAGDAYAGLGDELAQRFNAHAAEIPFGTAHVAADDAGKVAAELAPWIAASTALLAQDLANAATAVEDGIAQGPAALATTTDNRLKAAAILTAVLRAQGKDWKVKVKPFVAASLKGAPVAEELAARVLLGKAPDAVHAALACAAEAVPCDNAPVVDALIAVGRAGDAAEVLAPRAAKPDAPLETLRLTLGVAELAGNQPLYQQLATRFTQLRPDDLLGWDNLVAAYLRAGDARAALQTLLQVPGKVADAPELLVQVGALVDALWDFGTPEALPLEQRAALLALAQPPQSATRQLLLALADGWAGKLEGLDARLAALPAQPHVAAWRACLALAEHRLDDAHKLLDPLQGEALTEPLVLAAQLEMALQDPEATDVRIAELRKAWLLAEVRHGRLGRSARSQRWDVELELRTWGLEPPVRWPLTGRLGR